MTGRRKMEVVPLEQRGPDRSAGSWDRAGGHAFGSISAGLNSVRLRLRRYVLMEGLALTLLLLFSVAIVQLTLDWVARGLQWSMRASLLGVMVLLVAWQLWRRVWTPLRVRFGAAEAARLLERRDPTLASVLLSAVRFDANEVGPPEVNSPALVASVIEQASRRARSIDFASVLKALEQIGYDKFASVKVYRGASFEEAARLSLEYLRKLAPLSRSSV